MDDDICNTRKFKPNSWNDKQNPQRCLVQTYKMIKLDNRPESMLHNEDPFSLAINYV